jgi:hypothetical protein
MKVFSQDPVYGITTYWHYDESTDTATLQKSQEVEGLLDINKAHFNDAPNRWGDWSRVASIPLTVYQELKTKGVVDDERAFKRWLNDPDNRFFRTRPGTV